MVSMEMHCSIYHLLQKKMAGLTERRTPVVSSMTAAVKSQIQPRPVGQFFVSTNIPFCYRNSNAFLTIYQEDFQPLFSKKVEPASQPPAAQVDHRDVKHFKEYLSEAKASYQRHPLLQLTRTRKYPNFKMHSDLRDVSFVTTQSQDFQPRLFQRPPTPIRQTPSINMILHVEKLPESTYKASFTPQHGSPVVKARAKHLEEGFPTIKGDRRHCSSVSHYNATFQGTWGTAAQSVETHSSVAMGDPVKIVERETTHATTFSWPTVCSPPVVKERLKINLRQFPKDSWSCTSREAFGQHKLGDPVVLTRKDQNFSSIPKGDTDMRRNKERMSVTTNRIFFSDLNHTERPVFVRGPDLMTKSHIQFSSPRLSGLYYTSTAKETYSRQQGERARPGTQFPSNILIGPGHELLSTTKTDYIPLKTSRSTPYLPQQTNLFPASHQHFSTTNREHYPAKL